MVTIKNTYTIVPAEPTPSGPLPLSECDQIQDCWSFAPTLYVYPQNNSFSFSFPHVIETLRVSLSRVLVPFYPLAGRLRLIEGGRFELDCNAIGVEMVAAESESKLDEFGDFGPTDKIKALQPQLDYSLPIEKLPAMSVRVTRLACGGVTIGLAISHILMDGVAAMSFIKAWTKLARGEPLDQSDLPFHDRTIFGPKDLSSPRRQIKMPVDMKPFPLLLGQSDATEEQGKETTVAMLKLTKEQIQKLKDKTNSSVKEISCTEMSFSTEKGAGLQDKPYSRFEAISAHVWKCMCKARGHEFKQPTVSIVAVECRKRVNPPLPKGYIGNAAFRTITDPRCVSGDLATKPLSYAAGKIREGVNKMTDEYIDKTLSFIKNQEDVSRMRLSLQAAVGSQNGKYLGNPNMYMNSWIGMATCDADFGWGKPTYMGPTVLSCDGKCFIYRTSEDDGSLILALRLQVPHMTLFQEFFYKDL